MKHVVQMHEIVFNPITRKHIGTVISDYSLVFFQCRVDLGLEDESWKRF